MSRAWKVILLALVTGAGARDAAAQWNVARFATDRNQVYTTFGLDPAWVGTLGYGRVIPLYRHDFQVTGDIGMAVAGLDPRDFRARVGVRTSLARWRSLRLTGSATAIARGTENSIYRAFNWGADFTATAGVYRHGWFAAAEVGKDKAIVTHITHSDWYRRYFYPDAKDGWYLDAGGTIHYGVTAGVALGRAEVTGRFGWLRTERLNEMMPPMYAGVGLGFGF